MKVKQNRLAMVVKKLVMKITDRFCQDSDVVIHHGDCLDLLSSVPDKSVRLIVTSPPYNIGKEYEEKTDIKTYISQQSIVIKECNRILSDNGSICWQVGNYVKDGTIIPLDTALFPIFQDLGLVMRNRIVWHFEHGLHCSKRFSGRYETISWFTKKNKNYIINLVPVKVPQKYPSNK